MDSKRRDWRRTGGNSSALPLVIAHRGSSALLPENSLDAFRRAAKDGADGVELDVLCCASGEVVVFHDDDLARLGGRPERVADLPLGSLRQVELQGGVFMPTLAEAFEACGPDLLVNVELKSAGLRDRSLPRLVESVSAVLDATGTAARVLISSFDPRAVWLWQRRRPDVRAALLCEKAGAAAWLKAMTLSLLRPAAVHPEDVMCEPARVRAWQAGGYAVNVWTVDDPARLRALHAMGVDGVITNDPAAARTALAARA